MDGPAPCWLSAAGSARLAQRVWLSAAGSAGWGGRRPAHPDAHTRSRGRDMHVIGQAGDHGQAEAGRDPSVVRALYKGGASQPVGSVVGAARTGIPFRGMLAHTEDKSSPLSG